MTNIWIKKDDWNSILDDIDKIQELAKSDDAYRLYFRGHEVERIAAKRATIENRNEWLTIWIYSTGEYDGHRAQGWTQVIVGLLDKWYMDEKEIRYCLKELEVRKIDVVKKFG